MDPPLILGILKDKAALGQPISLNYLEVRNIIDYIRSLERKLEILGKGLKV